MNDVVDRLRGVIAGPKGRDRARLLGLALTGLWLAAVLLFWLMGPDEAPAAGGLSRLLSAMGVILPVALIWMAVGLARAIADLRAEAELLRARLDLLRADAPAAEPALPPAPAGAAAIQGGAARAMPARGPRPAEPRPASPAPTPVAPVEIPPEVLIAALNFPDGPDDHRAIQALRLALSDPETTRVIRAAQDVVTLLAKGGIYMDDLAPPAIPPATWRRLAAGGRSAALTDLAVVSDAEMLDLTADLMRNDEVFRDAAHHFLRQYDRTLTRVGEDLNDAGLAAMADTRSGRAFILLAQVAAMPR